MATSIVDADSLLAVDIGSVTTRVHLIDVVDGRYRYLASGTAGSTAAAPYRDVREGVRLAIEQLQAVTGRTLIGPDENLIMPAMSDGSGVDIVAATLSAGPPLRLLVVGLLEEVTLESARRLAETTYSRILETFSLNDRQKTEARIDALLKIRPDLVVFAGGTDGGANQSVMKLLEAIGLASYMMPNQHRPEVLFAGNRELTPAIDSEYGTFFPIHIAPNIRPRLDVEQLDAAQIHLAKLHSDINCQRLPGLQEINHWARGGLLPGAAGLGRVVRFLSEVYSAAKGVLGIDIGAGATTVAAAFSGNLSTGAYPQFGLGQYLPEILDYTEVGDISRWLHFDIPAREIRNYIYHKGIYPGSLPADSDELALEQALARVVMQQSVQRLSRSFNEQAFQYSGQQLPWFEPILASGSVLTRAASRSEALLMLLDGLQPTGITTLVLDQHHLAPVLGAAAAVNSLLAVQVLESNAFVNLGTVISPLGEARYGTPVLRVRMEMPDGQESRLEIKRGALEIIPLPAGQKAHLHLTPLHRFDVGMGGPGRGGGVRVVGGAFGVVIDARGRPIRLPSDNVQRQDLLGRWRWAAGVSP